jgi:hypothetical protein
MPEETEANAFKYSTGVDRLNAFCPWQLGRMPGDVGTAFAIHSGVRTDEVKEAVMDKKSKAIKNSKGGKHLRKGKHEEAVKPLTTVNANVAHYVNTQILAPTTGPSSPGSVVTGWDLVTNKGNV